VKDYKPITKENVSRIGDKVGQPIDISIRKPVVAVNRYCPTIGSCEGHAGLGKNPTPYIDIESAKGDFASLRRKVIEHNRTNPENKLSLVRMAGTIFSLVPMKASRQRQELSRSPINAERLAQLRRPMQDFGESIEEEAQKRLKD
jgi:hypothetical protein